MTTQPPEDPDEFDEAAFEAAFAAEFGQAVEPDREVPAQESDGGASPSADGPPSSSADGPASRGADGPPSSSADGVASSGGAVATPGGDAATTQDSAAAAAQQGGDTADSRRVLVVVLTPIASAPVLAALCSMANVDAHIVPSKRGALAAKVITTSGELDPGELLTGAPTEAGELAAVLSRTAKAGVVLLTARLGQGEEGITGTISGREYTAGEPGEEVSPGLILAHADDVVEQILFGTLDPAQAPGRLEPRELSRWQAARLMAKQARRRRP